MNKQFTSRIEVERELWDSKAAVYDQLVNQYFGETYKVIIHNVTEDGRESKKLLDAATGTGILAIQLKKYVPHITAVDISPKMIAVASQKAVSSIDFRVGDICNLEFPDKTFDTVIASNVLHFLYEPGRAMNEMRRVLIDKGKIIVPTFCHGENMRSKFLSAVLSLLRQRPRYWWNRKNFMQFVESNGFEIIKDVYVKGKIPLVYVVAIKT